MNTTDVEELVTENGVITIKADKTHERPDIDQLLAELGNPGAGIPFLAIFPADGGAPITFDGPITQQMVLDALEKAGPSSEASSEPPPAAAETASADPLLAP